METRFFRLKPEASNESLPFMDSTEIEACVEGQVWDGKLFIREQETNIDWFDEISVSEAEKLVEFWIISEYGI